MKKQWTLGKRLLASFAGVALITLALGLVGFYGAAKSDRAIDEIGHVRLPSVDSLLRIAEQAENIRATTRTLAIPGLEPEVRQAQYANLASAREQYDVAWEIYEPLPQTPREAELWQQFVPAWHQWRDANNRLMELSREYDAFGIPDAVELARQIERFSKDHYILVQDVLHMLHMGESFEGGDDHNACGFGRWLASFSTDNRELASIIDGMQTPHRRFHEAVGNIQQQVAAGNMDQARTVYEEEMVPNMVETFGGFDRALALANEAAGTLAASQEQLLGPVERAQSSSMNLLGQLVQVNRDVAAQTTQEAHSASVFMKAFSLVAMILGLVLALGLGILITRSINRVLERLAGSLGDGAEQVASASGQVSSASQSLAEGASQQAAAIEETSSSLEEMSSMTRQNADNAGQADALMKEANEVVGQANTSMKRLSSSMEDITRASEETSKIVKTIDEIAFQTNLLALNAAVEAARAGEAGAGFAVVADEVRNLAMRAAEAAKNTADLIEGTVKKVREGAGLTSDTNQAFIQVAESAGKVADLLGEISAASQEQSQGIDQVNRAVTEMDKVTQQNAANAEESASASEELNAQAEQMKIMVEELVTLVGGNGKNFRESSSEPVVSRKPPQKPVNGFRQEKSPGRSSALPPHKAKDVKPEQLIPLEGWDARDAKEF